MWRMSTDAGPRPVLLAKRCDSEGMLPSGRSSSMRSTRCIGTKTTPGENGSPSLTRDTRSSNEASSTPQRLNPSGVRERMAPQSFSLGLPSVTSTIMPGRNGLPPVGAAPSLWVTFSTTAIVAGRWRLCNSSPNAILPRLPVSDGPGTNIYLSGPRHQPRNLLLRYVA